MTILAQISHSPMLYQPNIHTITDNFVICLNGHVFRRTANGELHFSDDLSRIFCSFENYDKTSEHITITAVAEFEKFNKIAVSYHLNEDPHNNFHPAENEETQLKQEDKIPKTDQKKSEKEANGNKSPDYGETDDIPETGEIKHGTLLYTPFTPIESTRIELPILKDLKQKLNQTLNKSLEVSTRLSEAFDILKNAGDYLICCKSSCSLEANDTRFEVFEVEDNEFSEVGKFRSLDLFPEFDTDSFCYNGVVRIELNFENVGEDQQFTESRITGITCFNRKIFAFQVHENVIIKKFEYSGLESIPTCIEFFDGFHGVLIGTSSEGLLQIRIDSDGNIGDKNIFKYSSNNVSNLISKQASISESDYNSDSDLNTDADSTTSSEPGYLDLQQPVLQKSLTNTEKRNLPTRIDFETSISTITCICTIESYLIFGKFNGEVLVYESCEFDEVLKFSLVWNRFHFSPVLSVQKTEINKEKGLVVTTQSGITFYRFINDIIRENYLKNCQEDV